MWMNDVLVVTTEEIGLTETNMILYWVDRDTGPGFFSQDNSRVWATFEVEESRSIVDTTGLIDEMFHIHDTM